jgi:putative ABC transport system permease protein
MLTDFRLGLRQFARRPVVSLAAILSLALGIGANTAIFSVLHGVVLNPLSYADSDRLMVVWETSADNPARWVAPANFVDWRRDSTSFSSLAAFDTFSPTLSGLGEPERLRALGGSGTFFTTLGTTAEIGRTLLPSDDQADAPPVAVLSHGFWVRRFGQSPAAVGQRLVLDGRAYQIAGVMPASFETPLVPAVDVWLSGDRGVPRTFPFSGDLASVRDSHVLFVIGRLAPSVSREAAQRELGAIMVALAQRYPQTNAGLGVNVKALHEEIVGDVRGLVLLLQLAVGVMLLIACANVAHLLLGQLAGRQSEMTTRAALGAGRSRLVRQLVAETLVLAIPGGAIGLLFAWAGLGLLVAAAPAELPRVGEVALDPVVLGFAMVTMLATAALFGLGPALQIAKQESLAHTLTTLRTTSSRRVHRWHHAIVVAELAMAQVLLVGAGLLLASFVAAQRVPLGFDTNGRVAADLSLTAETYLRPRTAGEFTIDPSAKIAFVDAVLDRLRSAPGVRAAAAGFTSPLTGAPNRGIGIEGRPPKGPGLEDTADFQVVTPDYFRALGARVVRGRDFDTTDQAATTRVAVVNQAFAERYFPGEDPIGRRFRFGGAQVHEIVGVASDMRYRRIEQPADPTFYLPLTQNTERWPFLSFTVWSDSDTITTATLIREAIRTADPNLAVTRIRSFDQTVSTVLAPRRFNTTLVAVFAGAALLLAAVGTYGVMSYAVSTRTRELGVRAALGAEPSALLWLVLRQGATLTGLAVALGVGVGAGATRLMSTMLFGVTPTDVSTFVSVAALLTLVSLLATWLPARRAVGISPVSALRDE